MDPSSSARTNTIPSHIDALRTQELIEYGGKDIHKSGDEAANVTTKQRTSDGEYSATLSHARRLPTELLAEIFTQCTPLYRMRLTLCQICSAWRHVAISTPRLWTDISLVLRQKHLDDKMSLLRTSCDRAGILPLSITLRRSSDYALPQDPIVTLITYIPRIWKMNFLLSGTCFQTICALPDGSLPLLQDFYFLGVGGPIIPPDAAPITVFRSAPCLRKVEILDASFDPLVLRLPHQLTSLSLDCILTPNQFFGVLCDCPNLERLDVTAERLPDIEILPKDVISLPRLHTLLLIIDGVDSGAIFFDILALPVLDHLEVTYMGIAPWPHSSVLSLVSRSACYPTALALRSAIWERHLLECLQALPSLVRLDIEPQFECRALLDALQYVDREDHILVPRLQELDIDVDDGLHEFEESLVEMIESRWWPASAANPPFHKVARLRKVHISITCWPMDRDVVLHERLRQFRDEGLNVVIRGRRF